MLVRSSSLKLSTVAMYMFQQLTVFLVCSSMMCHCCCSTNTQNNQCFQRFAGDRATMTCPSNSNDIIAAVTWYLTLPGSTQRQLDINADSNLSEGVTVRFLVITVSPEYEGAYSCSKNNALEHEDAGCLIVLGRAMFAMCWPNSNCEQPFQLNGLVGQEVTFNSSITFVDGGSQNQEIRTINLFKGSADTLLYNCNTPMDGCSNASRIQVVMFSVENYMSVLITLWALNMSDMDQYKVEIIAYNLSNTIERKNIFFDLAITDPVTTPTTTEEPTSTAAPTTSTTAPTTSTVTTTEDESTPELRGDDSPIAIQILVSILVVAFVVILVLAVLLGVYVHNKFRMKSSQKSPSTSSEDPSEEMRSEEWDLSHGDKAVVIHVHPHSIKILPSLVQGSSDLLSNQIVVRSGSTELPPGETSTDQEPHPSPSPPTHSSLLDDQVSMVNNIIGDLEPSRFGQSHHV